MSNSPHALRKLSVALRATLVVPFVFTACTVESPPEPEEAQASSFDFHLPETFQPLALRGEGSERMFAPSSTGVLLRGEEVTLQAGNAFSLRVNPNSLPLSELKGRLAGKLVAYQAADVMVVGQGSELSMVVVRELVPEWDESDRRRISCATQGLLDTDTPLHTFTAEQIGAMVAACRTLELPRLE